MSSLLSLILSLDPTLHHFTPETLPEAGFDRIHSLFRVGALDRHLTDGQLTELAEIMWDMCSQPFTSIKGDRVDDVEYRIFGDDSLHVVSNADSSVWLCSSDFVHESLLCDRDRDELTGADARLASFLAIA